MADEFDDVIDAFGRLAFDGNKYEEEFGDDEQDDDYYVHIDVLEGSSSMVSKRLNTHMVAHNAFDPRQGFHFPLDLHVAPQRDTALTRRREIGVGVAFYELWKVKKNFSVFAFRNLVHTLPAGTSVRLVRLVGSDHQIFVFNGAAAPYVRPALADH
jgi:hypothetical protein